MTRVPPSNEQLPSCNPECSLYRARNGAEELLLTDPDVPEVAKLAFLQSKPNQDYSRALEIATRGCDGKLLPDGQCPRIVVFQAMRSLYGGEVYPVAMRLANEQKVRETIDRQPENTNEKKIVEVVGMGDSGVDVRLDDETLRADQPLARAVIEMISRTSGLSEVHAKERITSRTQETTNFIRSHVMPVAFFAGSVLLEKLKKLSK